MKAAQAFSEPHRIANFSTASKAHSALLASPDQSSLILSMIVQIAFLAANYLAELNLGCDSAYLQAHVLIHLSNAF
jgi:hypothetical protein